MVSIVGRYAVRAERSGEPWDRVPVELEPRTDDERAIAEHAPIGERHPVARGIEGCRRAADPFGACWDQPSIVAPGCLARNNTPPHPRHTGHEIMIRAWPDHPPTKPGPQ